MLSGSFWLWQFAFWVALVDKIGQNQAGDHVFGVSLMWDEVSEESVIKAKTLAIMLQLLEVVLNHFG